jgi:hypothetical protein
MGAVKTVVFTVPTHSIRQSRVTGPQVKMKCHRSHRSQWGLTNNEMEAKISVIFHLKIKFLPLSPYANNITVYKTV